VSAANGAIGARKAATAAADLASAQAELARLEATKRRHEPEAVRACDDYVQLDEKKKELERQKAEVREQLEAHCLEVVQPYENRINYYLDLFNAGFKIVRTGHGYPGAPRLPISFRSIKHTWNWETGARLSTARASKTRSR
jgi:hypothetical protein